MFTSIIRSFVVRVLILVVSIHALLGVAAYGLFTANIPVQSMRLLLVGVSGLYLCSLLGLPFVLWPVIRLLKKLRDLLRWKDWIISELPKLIALVPVVLEAIRSFIHMVQQKKAAATAAEDVNHKHGAGNA